MSYLLNNLTYFFLIYGAFEDNDNQFRQMINSWTVRGHNNHRKLNQISIYKLNSLLMVINWKNETGVRTSSEKSTAHKANNVITRRECEFYPK